MVKVKSFVATGETTQGVLSELAEAIEKSPIEANFVCVFYDAVHDDGAILEFVQTHFADAAILGGTSCNGVMGEAGLAGAGSIGLLAVQDVDGNYGTALVRLDGDVAECAERALHEALDNAGCAGELPELVWVYQSPGREEAVIDGLRRVIDDRCPIIGGSSADNGVGGKWRQIGNDSVMTDGLAIGVLFSSGGIGFTFQGGYEPSGESGIVTRARGRKLISIDGEPASHVYNRWIGDLLNEKIENGGNIFTSTTLYPIGIDAGKIEGITHYLLIHPDRVLKDGGMSTFASIEEGTRLYSMRGERSRLVDRAGKVASAAAAMLPEGKQSLAGGLVVYCAGCMLAVGYDMPNVAQKVTQSFEGKPFLGCFTFGEQGPLLGRNTHGNLMISAIAFGS